MLKFDPAKMPFSWYKAKNHNSGNIGNFNYRIFPEKDSLLVSYWIGIYCYASTKEKFEQKFPLSAQGLEQGWLWLEQEFSKCDKKQLEQPLTILNTQPYSPLEQEQEPQPPEETAPF